MLNFLSGRVEIAGMWSGIVCPDDIVFAYDGKVSGRMLSWGVGVQDLRNGVGHYVGGRWQDAKSFLGQEGNLDIATAEALAMHFALEWVRKRGKPSRDAIGIGEPEMMRRTVSLLLIGPLRLSL